MRRRGGFTLVEVIVALLVLELGLLAVAGLVSLSTRTLGRAVRVERAVAAIQAVADSLVGADEVDEGERSAPGTVVRWSPVDGEVGGLRWLRLRASPSGTADTATVLVDVRLGVPAEGRP